MENTILELMRGKPQTDGQRSYLFVLLKEHELKKDEVENLLAMKISDMDRYQIAVVIDTLKREQGNVSEALLKSVEEWRADALRADALRPEQRAASIPTNPTIGVDLRETKSMPAKKPTTVNNEALIADMGLPKDFPSKFIMDYMGKPYILVAGLQWLASQKGYQAIATADAELETGSWQAQVQIYPTLSAAQIEAVAHLAPDAQKMALDYLSRPTNGIGTANRGNVKPQMMPFLREMAQTRAKGRALRDFVRYGGTAYEELPAAEVEEVE